MAGIWIYSEITSVAEELLTVGRELADKLTEPLCAVTICAEDAQTLIASGADKVFVLQGNNPWPESYAVGISELAAKEAPRTILIGGTLRGKDLAAKVAAQLNAGLVTDALAIRTEDGAIETDRMMYGGLAVCTEVIGERGLITVQPRTYEAPTKDNSRSGEVITLEVITAGTMVVGNVCPIIRKGADITTADKLVCVGRGIAKQEDMELAAQLATALGAEIGCTRSIAEDYHWLPNESYIGLSGQRVKPSLYLSMGISGQVQHVAGIRDSKIIVAIDSNENAPIFGAADYGIVGDLYQIVPLLTEALKK